MCAQLRLTPLRPHELYSLPNSSVHRIFQARILGVDCHFLFQRVFLIQGSALAGRFFTSEPPGKPPYLYLNLYLYINHYYKNWLMLLQRLPACKPETQREAGDISQPECKGLGTREADDEGSSLGPKV